MKSMFRCITPMLAITWAITFDQNKDGALVTKNMYLFSAVPSISYNFKY